jgi:hypothetical protein
MDGRSPVSLDVRREQFEELLISLFRFTQVFGVAVREGAYISVAERTDLSFRHDVPVATATKDQLFPRHSPLRFPARRTYLHQVVCQRQLINHGRI